MCDCGNKTIISKGHLLNNHTTSCGCYRLRQIKEKAKMRCLSTTKIYRVYRTMLNRCHNFNSQKYNNYGGRGIIVCKQWRDNFLNFYDWAIANGYQENLTIERINVNGNYEPSNCTWITMEEQAQNKRCNIKIAYKGKTYPVKKWSQITGIKVDTLKYRYRQGWSSEKIIETPVKERKK